MADSQNNILKLFIVGSPRSGTTLMNSILFASKHFAEYHAEAKLLSLCMPKYGSLEHINNKKRFLSDWYRSRQFQQTHLSEDEFNRTLNQANNYFDLQLRMMNVICRKQHKLCWSDSTPSNIFVLNEILQSIPDCKIIHMIRDGRDVALSLYKLQWLSAPSFIKSKQNRLWWAAHQWQYSVLSGIKHNSNRVLHVRYEDLIRKPNQTLDRISEFINKDLSVVYLNNFKSLKRGNSAYGNESIGLSKASLERWRQIDQTTLHRMNSACYKTLRKFHYSVPEDCFEYKLSYQDKCAKSFLKAKGYLLRNTVMGRCMKETLNYELD